MITGVVNAKRGEPENLLGDQTRQSLTHDTDGTEICQIQNRENAAFYEGCEDAD
jgi:hypothetical protein